MKTTTVTVKSVPESIRLYHFLAADGMYDNRFGPVTFAFDISESEANRYAMLTGADRLFILYRRKE